MQGSRLRLLVIRVPLRIPFILQLLLPLLLLLLLALLLAYNDAPQVLFFPRVASCLRIVTCPQAEQHYDV